jgi:hypothetical protein
MKLPSILAALALTSCATVPPAEPGPTAGIGQVAYTNGLRVRPVAVVEDSRCPVDVQCVWAGRMVVRSEVIGGSWHETRDLELGKSQQIADGALTLVAAVPQKKAGTAIDPRSYRFTFDFQGGI